MIVPLRPGWTVGVERPRLIVALFEIRPASDDGHGTIIPPYNCAHLFPPHLQGGDGSNPNTPKGGRPITPQGADRRSASLPVTPKASDRCLTRLVDSCRWASTL